MKKSSPQDRTNHLLDEWQKQEDESLTNFRENRHRYELHSHLLLKAETWEEIAPLMMKCLVQLNETSESGEASTQNELEDWVEYHYDFAYDELDKAIRELVERSSRRNEYHKHTGKEVSHILMLALRLLRSKAKEAIAHATSERNEISKV